MSTTSIFSGQREPFTASQTATKLPKPKPKVAEPKPPGVIDKVLSIFAGEKEEGSGGVADFIRRLAASGVDFKSVDMNRSSLEDIFVSLVGRRT